MVDDAHIAILNDDLELLKKSINDDNLNAIDRDHCTPLYATAAHGRTRLMKYLIQRGADLNFTDLCKYAPIMKAVQRDRVECVKLLADAGCALDIVYEDITVLFIALQNNCYNSINLLIDHGVVVTNDILHFDAYRLDLVYSIINTRLETRHKALAILTMHKQKHGPNHFTKQDKHVIKMISKHIWSMRFTQQPIPHQAPK
jgi:ankyrin repeat protein